MKRIVALFFVLLMVLPYLVSCGKSPPPATTWEDFSTKESIPKQSFSLQELIDKINSFAKTKGYPSCSDFTEKDNKSHRQHTFSAFGGNIGVIVLEQDGQIVQITTTTTTSTNTPDADLLSLLAAPTALCTPDLNEQEHENFHATQSGDFGFGSSVIFEYREGDWKFVHLYNDTVRTLSATKNTPAANKKFNDQILTVCTVAQIKNNHFSSEIVVENPSDNAFDQAIYQRNQEIQKTYGCTVRENTLSLKDLRTALLANEYVGDFIYSAADRLISFTENLHDLSSLNGTESGLYLSTGKNRYHFQQSLLLNFGAKRLFVSSTPFLSDALEGNVILFNRDLLSSVSPETDLYQQVESGNWTVDSMAQLMLKAGSGRTGYVSSAEANFNHHLAAGRILFPVGSDMTPSFSQIVPASTVEIMERLRPLLLSSQRTVSNSPAKDFAQGNALFCAADLNSALNQTYSFQVGALPFPKLQQSQIAYYNPIQSTREVFAIPKSVENGNDWQKNGFDSGLAQSAYLLDLFCYETERFVGEKMQDQLFATVFSDEKDRDMIRLAQEAPIFDAVVLYDLGHCSKVFTELTPVGADGAPNLNQYDSLINHYGSLIAITKRETEDRCKDFKK